MDPNLLLQKLRAALAMTTDSTATQEDAEQAAYDAADYAETLDKWLTAGGFFPDAWMQNRR
jgi:hypothetical protein